MIFWSIGILITYSKVIVQFINLVNYQSNRIKKQSIIGKCPDDENRLVFLSPTLVISSCKYPIRLSRFVRFSLLHVSLMFGVLWFSKDYLHCVTTYKLDLSSRISEVVNIGYLSHCERRKYKWFQNDDTKVHSMSEMTLWKWQGFFFPCFPRLSHLLVCH